MKTSQQLNYSPGPLSLQGNYSPKQQMNYPTNRMNTNYTSTTPWGNAKIEGQNFHMRAQLTSPPHTRIRAHIVSYNFTFNIDNFIILSVIYTCILKSLIIFKTRPILNDSQSAFLLSIICK